MTMRRAFGARFLASAFLLCAAASSMPLAAAERLRLAAERPDRGCPVVTGPEAVLGMARLASDTAPPPDASACLLVVRLDSLDDAALDAASQQLTAAKGAAATILSIPASEDADRFAYAVKRLASVARSASPDGRIGLDTPEKLEGDLAEQLSPYDDALIVRPSDPPRPDTEQPLWILAGAGPGSPADAVIAALARFPHAELIAVDGGEAPLDDAGLAALSAASALPHGRRLGGSDRDVRPPRGRERGHRGPLLRREDVHADPLSAERSEPPREGRDRAVWGALLTAPPSRTSRAARSATSPSRARAR